MRSLLRCLGFVVLSTGIMVLLSVKMCWCVQDYAFFELHSFYFLPTFIGLWAMQRFGIDTIAPLMLAGALYRFIVEGMMAQVMCEGGLFG